jgi:hypothetical protein
VLPFGIFHVRVINTSFSSFPASTSSAKAFVSISF